MTLGFKLGYYKISNGKIREALISIETLSVSHIIDQRQNEIYDFIKVNLIKVLKIENLSGEVIPSAYLRRKYSEIYHEVKPNEIIRIKHPDFTQKDPDVTFISYYTTKTGALNQATEVDVEFTGVKYHFYNNGKIQTRNYYVNGTKTHSYGFYNNPFNSMNYCWTFEFQSPNQTFPLIREYIYDSLEAPIAQYVIHEGRVINHTIYNYQSNHKSIYLQETRL